MSKIDLDNKNNRPEKLHIFINGVKFDESEDVKETMTGAELAALVEVDANNADITRKNKDEQIGSQQAIPIKNGDHFEIIRKSVIAG